MSSEAIKVIDAEQKLKEKGPVDRFLKRLEVTEDEKLVDLAENARKVASQLPVPENAHLLITPAIDPSWLNNLVAYPNWPHASTLADYSVSFQPGHIITALSAIQLLENPLHSRQGLTVTEDDVLVQQAYESIHYGRHEREMKVQSYYARHIRDVARHPRMNHEVPGHEELDSMTYDEESTTSEMSFLCVGNGCQTLRSNSQTGNGIGRRVRTEQRSYFPRYSSRSTSGSDSSHSSDAITLECAPPPFKHSFPKMPIRKPDLRSSLPSARVVEEYDRLRVIAQAWNQENARLLDRLYSSPRTYPGLKVPHSIPGLRRINAVDDLRQTAKSQMFPYEAESLIQRCINFEPQQRSCVPRVVEQLDMPSNPQVYSESTFCGGNMQDTLQTAEEKSFSNRKHGEWIRGFVKKLFRR